MENKFISNKTEVPFIDELRNKINHCDCFYFSVSFIKFPGFQLILKNIIEALDRGVKGKLITSTYQNFTDIKSLEYFLRLTQKYPNFECHLDMNCFGDNGFHSKGYLFRNGNSNELLIGSSNITRFALLKNIEWNVSLSNSDSFDSFDGAFLEFNQLWSKTYVLSEELIQKYKAMQEYALVKWDMDYFDDEVSTIKPNKMQREALKQLCRYRGLGVTKALIVAATGSGKTYLAAFDAKNTDVQKLLYVVHRETILVDAMKTFEKVFGNKRTYGYFTGSSQELNKDFVFATNVMLEKHLYEFKKDEFQTIILDECHHLVAEKYKEIMKYFTPNFYLGLTATPERLDNQDVFSLFDRNVPYDLRLKGALENDVVVPFHYYGIRDEYVDYQSENKDVVSREIAKQLNCNFISDEIEKHRPYGKLKAIAFCTTISHCQTMANIFNDLGYDSLALTGEDHVGARIKAFNDLQDDANSLEIIFCVDILNEGVDIPSINMVLFLRPTESPTIFLQQLGRGLRKYPGKEYVTILDFIGNNYNRSIQIAKAFGMYSESSFIEKPYLRDMIATDFKSLNLPGVIIKLDELSKEEILRAIDSENGNKKEFLKKDYENFKKYLKKETYPSHMDYLNCEFAPDLLRFLKCKLQGKKNISYYNFLKKIGEESLPFFNSDEVSLINSISDLLPLVRPDEYLIIKQVINENEIKLDTLVGYNSKVTKETLEHALKCLKYTNQNKNRAVIDNNRLNLPFVSTEIRSYINDLVEYGLTREKEEFGEYDGQYLLYGNYYKEQIMEILLSDSLSFQQGTKYLADGSTYLFVGLKKDKEKEEKLNYKDKFLSPEIFQWESVNNTTFNNAEGKKLLKAKIVHLFVRKMDEEDGVTLQFKYFGSGKFVNPRESFVNVNENGKITKKSTLLFDVELDNQVPEELRLEYQVPPRQESVEKQE